MEREAVERENLPLPPRDHLAPKRDHHVMLAGFCAGGEMAGEGAVFADMDMGTTCGYGTLRVLR